MFGSGKFCYKVEEGWGRLPQGWTWGWIPAVACDSRDRVFVYSRSEHPLIIFDREGNFLESWGEGVLVDAHGIWIDEADNVYCTERENHCLFKFDSVGKLIMTLGTPGRPAVIDEDPFNLPGDSVTLSDGDIFISDGYGNHRVHHYTSQGKLLKSWGERGIGPGQFELSHCVRVDRHERLWVCDRTNDRIQIFDREGNFLEQWSIPKPDTIYFDPNDDVVYVAEMNQQVSIWTLEGELLSKWGSSRKSEMPGEFSGAPHGIWADSRGDLYVGQVATDGGLQKFVRQ